MQRSCTEPAAQGGSGRVFQHRGKSSMKPCLRCAGSRTIVRDTERVDAGLVHIRQRQSLWHQRVTARSPNLIPELARLPGAASCFPAQGPKPSTARLAFAVTRGSAAAAAAAGNPAASAFMAGTTGSRGCRAGSGA